ncbi:MAG: hypothetical protein EBY24_22510 [Betaproteobacteria bacterium]|nr:hypothetical protein [Betaproteobacteria bacterium]
MIPAANDRALTNAFRRPERIAAQVINMGDYDDVQDLVNVSGKAFLQRVLRSVEIGQRRNCFGKTPSPHPPASLFWCAGTELSAQGCGGGFCHTGATGDDADRSSHQGRGRAWDGTAGPCVV